MKVFKCISVLYNSLFMIVSLGTIIVGIIILSSGKLMLNTNNPNQSYGDELGYILIGFGVVLFVLNFIGLVASISESRCLLGIFMSLLIILLITQTAILILLNVNFFGKLAIKELRKELKNSLFNPYNNSSSEDNGNSSSINVFDHVMKEYGCCGIHNSTDFYNIMYQNNSDSFYYSDSVLPKSCCKSPSKEFCTDPTPENSYKNVGCFEKVLEYYKMYFNIGIGVLLGFNLLGFLLSIFVFRDSYYDYM